MKRVILGTAGHIDHGKTNLIRALTGIETDRLKEEQERGISIELGFAFLDLENDIRMGIIDVPGHERFVRHMVSGSGGIDLAALVVALDEGVMPQTVEHLDILQLLDVRLGLVVLTKLDLVDEELALLAEEDVRDVLKGTFLEDAPMVQVSSKTGEGIDRLRSVLAELAQKVVDRPVHGLLRLPVDRVFTLKGHGTVVTGTLLSGTISVGDEIEILPSGRRTSVRSLQSHKTQEETAYPGERTAVNLRGLEQAEVHRGEVLTHPTEFTPSYIVDVRFKSLNRAPFPIKTRSKVRLHHFTNEVEARIVFPNEDEIEPGREIMAQLRTSEPIVPAGGDRFVVRAVSPSVTLGGGVVLNPQGLKLRARTAKAFSELDNADDERIVEMLVKTAGIEGRKRSELLGLASLPAKKLDKILEKLKSSQTVVRIDPVDDRLVHGFHVGVAKKIVLERLAKFHETHPLKRGIPKQELRSAAPGGDKFFKRLMELLTASGDVTDEGEFIRLASHTVELKEEEKGLTDKLTTLIREGGNAPPLVKELVEKTSADAKKVKNLLEILSKENRIVRVKEDIYFSREFIEETKQRLAEFIEREGGITPSQFSAVTGSSRKYNIPLLEYFDRERFTMRVGDQRVLRGSATSRDRGSSA